MNKKPEVNEAARIVNSHFLQSPYEGKDWESVRKDIINELTRWAAKQELRGRYAEAEACLNATDVWVLKRISELKTLKDPDYKEYKEEK